MTTKTTAEIQKKSNFSEWHRVLLVIFITVLINIGIGLAQHSYGDGTTQNRISYLEKSVEDLKKTDANSEGKLDQQLEKIHSMDLSITELKLSSKHQEELLLELKKIITGK